MQIDFISNEEELIVECSPTEIEQVLLNLVKNAIYAMDEKVYSSDDNAKLEINTSYLGDNAIITLTDNGPGMPKELQEKIFNPFFTTKPIGIGTGLGLSISYKIITEHHHGRLSVFSEVGVGTKFSIVLPLRQ